MILNKESLTFCFLNSSHTPTGVISFWKQFTLKFQNTFWKFYKVRAMYGIDREKEIWHRAMLVSVCMLCAYLNRDLCSTATVNFESVIFSICNQNTGTFLKIHCLWLFKCANILKTGTFCPNAWGHNWQLSENQWMFDEWKSPLFLSALNLRPREMKWLVQLFQSYVPSRTGTLQLLHLSLNSPSNNSFKKSTGVFKWM